MKASELEKLLHEQNEPCVSISLNTHRTFPDNQQDTIALKNLVKEAEDRLLLEFEKRAIAPLLERLDALEKDIDVAHNLDSLHIFISNELYELFRSPHPVTENHVHIGPSFALKPLIRDLNRTESYYILLVSQSGVHLYDTINDHIKAEVRNGDFPFKESRHHITDSAQKSNAKAVDDQLKEYLNQIDKALVRACLSDGKHCVVISTPDTYHKLMEVADRPELYYGHSAVNYNDLAEHTLAQQAWKVVDNRHYELRKAAIEEMQEAVGHGKVITDLRDIYDAVMEGRADLLIANHNFSQAVRMGGPDQFALVNDAKAPGVIDDITNDIAREVLAKKGRAIFTGQEELEMVGSIAVKLRY